MLAGVSDVARVGLRVRRPSAQRPAAGREPTPSRGGQGQGHAAIQFQPAAIQKRSHRRRILLQEGRFQSRRGTFPRSNEVERRQCGRLAEARRRGGQNEGFQGRSRSLGEVSSAGSGREERRRSAQKTAKALKRGGHAYYFATGPQSQ